MPHPIHYFISFHALATETHNQESPCLTLIFQSSSHRPLYLFNKNRAQRSFGLAKIPHAIFPMRAVLNSLNLNNPNPPSFLGLVILAQLIKWILDLELV